MDICRAFYNRLILFFCACFSGILFALVWRKYEQTVQLSLVYNHYSSALRETNYEQWLSMHSHRVEHAVEEDLRYSEKNHKELESAFLFKKVPVLCLVFVNSHKAAESIKDTWAKRCNHVTFFGKFLNEKIPVLKVPASTPYQSFCYAFIHVLKKYSNKFSWLIVADDTTYALVENLRYYVAPLNSSMHYYLGHPVKDFSNLYNIGTAGIVLSYGCVEILASIYKSWQDCSSLKSPSWYFDQGLGKIFSSFNIHPVDTRDLQLKARFNPFSIDTMLIPGSISVFSSYWRTSVYLSDEGVDCCSDKAITFHDNSPSKMYLLEYLLYHLSVFRNSLKGLGNSPPVKMHSHKKYTSSRKTVADNIGEPFVHFISGNGVSKKKFKRHPKSKDREEILLNSIFSN